MKSYSLRVNYANLKQTVDDNYQMSLQTLGLCLLLCVIQIRHFRVLDINHLEFENKELQQLFYEGASFDHMVSLLGVNFSICSDMYNYVEEFLTMSYHKSSQNYISFTLEGSYMFHVQLKAVK